MIIRVALLLILAVLAGYAISQRGRTPLVSGAILLIALIGVAFVLVPDASTMLAQYVGVGRGADLLLYGFVVVTLCIIFNLHLRMRSLAEVSTALARTIALQNARAPTDEG